MAEARLLDVEGAVLHFSRLSAIDVGVCACMHVCMCVHIFSTRRVGELVSYQLFAALLAAVDTLSQ